MEPDFGGYATKFGVKCSDGRTITAEAFKHMDGKQIPLLWSHQHGTPENVLGHSILEWRPDGMYCKNFFNDTKSAEAAKLVVEHKDIDSMSIYANKLVERNLNVLHGDLIEVSLVHKGANPGARIDFVQIQHGYGENSTLETLSDEAVIYTDAKIELQHADTTTKTFQDVYDSLDTDQRELVNVMVKKALEEGGTAQHSDDDKHAATGDDGKPDEPDTSTEGDKKEPTTEGKDSVVEHSDKDGNMATRNVFDQNKKAIGDGTQNGGVLVHGGLTEEKYEALKHSVFDAFKKGATFKEAVESALAHDSYGITNIEVLFPDARTTENRPEWLTRRMGWVDGVIGGTAKLPFSQIKSMHADLTQDEARAKGYITGTLKKEQYFAITSRKTGPTTIYKKQKLDRDHIVDITDFDVVAWIWEDMKFMLREEIARAILIGDGREIDDPDKIDETSIRPIAYDDVFYTDVINIAANVGGQDLIDAVLRGRENYLGADLPTAYMTTSVMMDLMLQRNAFNERIYKSKAELAAALLVRDIVEVPVMKNLMRDGAEVQMVLVNLSDYSVGSTKGGEITQFDDFDIDYNQYKYLIEGRMSGCLVHAKTAQVVIRGTGTLATPTVPTFVTSTGVVTIPSVTGVVYKVQVAGDLGAADTTLSAGAQTAIPSGHTAYIKAVPASGYYFPHNFDADWQFTRS